MAATAATAAAAALAALPVVVSAALNTAAVAPVLTDSAAINAGAAVSGEVASEAIKVAAWAEADLVADWAEAVLGAAMLNRPLQGVRSSVALAPVCFNRGRAVSAHSQASARAAQVVRGPVREASERPGSVPVGRQVVPVRAPERELGAKGGPEWVQEESVRPELAPVGLPAVPECFPGKALGASDGPGSVRAASERPASAGLLVESACFLEKALGASDGPGSVREASEHRGSVSVGLPVVSACYLERDPELRGVWRHDRLARTTDTRTYFALKR